MSQDQDIGKATDPTTISSLKSRIHSSSLNLINTQSGGHYCPYNPGHPHPHGPQCPYCPYQYGGGSRSNSKRNKKVKGGHYCPYNPKHRHHRHYHHLGCPMHPYDNISNISNNTKNSNNRNIVSNAFINHIKTEKPINIEYMNVENNNVHKKINKNTNLNKVEYYLFEVNGKKYIGIRQLYTGKNGKKIKYLNHIKEVK